MARYYYNTRGQTAGPVSARKLKSIFEGFLYLSDDDLACPYGSSEWVPINTILNQIHADIRSEMIPIQNKRADILLTSCVAVFTIASIIQIISGISYCTKGLTTIGFSLIISSPLYLFPISVAYVLRQMFRHQLRD